MSPNEINSWILRPLPEMWTDNRPYSQRLIAIVIFRRICPRIIVQSKLVSVKKKWLVSNGFLKTESQLNYRDKCLNYFKTVC